MLLGARYYDPGQGRFLNRDPISYGGGINLYSYVTNGPLNGSDPSGLKNCLQAIADGDTDMRYDRCYQSNWNAGSRPGVAGAQAFVNQAILMVPGGGLIYMFAGYDVWGCHLSPWQRIIDGAKGIANAVGAADAVAGMGMMGASGAEPGMPWFSGGGSNACFVAGTPIQLADVELASGGMVAASLGTQANAAMPIERIKQGDVVASRNPNTGQTERKKVVRSFKRTVHEIVHLELADSKTGKVVESLRGTPEHPFFTPTGQVAMGQLKAGMQVITWRGPPLVVKAVSREHHPEGIAVYNFEVEGDHTYFIGKAQGGIWVHNTCPVGRGALSNAPELANDPFLARQPSVSGPKIDEIRAMMQKGTWDWAGREIKYNGNVIIDGHHRYIAARLAGIEPVMISSTEPVAKTFSWGQLVVDPTRWPGGY